MKTFAEFWPYYLGEHSKPATRALHFIGTSSVAGWLGLAIWQRSWVYFGAAFIAAYGFAWTGHFFIEKNRPATFKYPFWSFAADWKMWSLMLTGQLGPELSRLQPKAHS